MGDCRLLGFSFLLLGTSIRAAIRSMDGLRCSVLLGKGVSRVGESMVGFDEVIFI